MPRTDTGRKYGGELDNRKPCHNSTHRLAGEPSSSLVNSPCVAEDARIRTRNLFRGTRFQDEPLTIRLSSVVVLPARFERALQRF